MSLLEEIQARKPVQLCRFGKWLAAASKQDRSDLALAFADRTIKGKWIADALSARGVEGHIVDAVNDHRRGDCTVCPSTEDLLNVAS